MYAIQSQFSIFQEVSLILFGAEAGATGHFCEVCGNGFSNPRVLEDHMREHPTCPVCYEKLLSRHQYRDHLAAHPTCVKCGSMFGGTKELREHTEKEHMEIRPSVSAYQNPEVREAISSIQEPREGGRGKGVKPSFPSRIFRCDFCQEQLGSGQELEDHLHTVHLITMETAHQVQFLHWDA